MRKLFINYRVRRLSGMRFTAAILGVLMLSGSNSAQEAVAEPSPLMQAPPITLQSGDLGMRFQPSRAWTFDEMRSKGNLLNNPGSYTGLVFNLGAGKFIGSGHHEGGSEKVLSVNLTIDGKPADYMKGGVLQGKIVELMKESTLVTAHLKNVVRLNDGMLECEQIVTPQEDIQLEQVYAFMFPWRTQTTHWIARTTKDQLREGDFTNTDKNGC